MRDVLSLTDQYVLRCSDLETMCDTSLPEKLPEELPNIPV